MKIRLLRNARVRGSMFRAGSEVNVVEAQGRMYIRKGIAEEVGGDPAPRFGRGRVVEPEPKEKRAGVVPAPEGEDDEDRDPSEGDLDIPLDDEGEPDRDWIKGRLDELGVEFNPRSHTPTLVELLEREVSTNGKPR